jgi:hypothetical protein
MSETKRDGDEPTFSDFYSGLPEPDLVAKQTPEHRAPIYTVVIDGTALSCDGRVVGLRDDEVFCLGALMVTGSEGVSLRYALGLGFLDRGADYETMEAFTSAMRGVNYALTATCNISSDRGVRVSANGADPNYKLNPNIVFVRAADVEAAESRARATKGVGATASSELVPAKLAAKAAPVETADAATFTAPAETAPPRAAKATKAAASKPAKKSAKDPVSELPGDDEVLSDRRVAAALTRISTLPDINVMRHAGLRSPEEIAASLDALYPGSNTTAERVTAIANSDPMIKPHGGQYSIYAYRRIQAELRRQLGLDEIASYRD